MKKYITLFTLFIGFCWHVVGQQEPTFSLYMINPLVYNPAMAGTANFYQIRTNHRFQWAGFKDAPVTNSISAYGPHSKKDMGFGGTIYNDITGPTSRTGANGVFGYNIAVQSSIRVSFGLSLGLVQYKVDGTKITTYEDNDNYLQKIVYSSLVPDAGSGVYVYSPTYYGGFSAQHLLNIFSKDPDRDIKGVNILNTTMYLIGGYRYQIDRQWLLEPTLIVKKVIPAAFQFELSGKLVYKNMFWGGLAFRTQDALSIVLGYTYEKKIHFGYCFDLSVNAMRKYNTGSHEIVIGYNFDKIKKQVARKKK
jgi:type IX secretion system PorP/SprF family membrane protein